MKNKLARVKIIEINCVLGKRIRTTINYWQHIVDHKHGELRGKLKLALEALKLADEVYQNPLDKDICLYYYKINKHWICVVTRHINKDGFIITAYLTTKAKRKGIKIWPKKIK